MHTVYPATTLNAAITYPSADYPVPTYTTGTATEQTNGWASFTSQAILHLPDWSNGSGRPGLILCHGRGQTAYESFQPGGPSRWGDYTRALADAGFAVLGLDLGTENFGNNLALRAMDLAFTYLTGITGGTRVGVGGSSMGGLTALSWARKRPTQTAGVYLLNPFVDIDTVRGSAGWAAPYSVQPGDPNDHLSYAGSDPTFTNGAFKCSDDATFTTNAADQGHTPNRYPADWAGQRIVIAHAHLDPAIPYQASQWWVSATGSPTVRFRAVTAASAVHEPSSLLAGGATDAATSAAGGLPRAELRDFFHEVL